MYAIRSYYGLPGRQGGGPGTAAGRVVPDRGVKFVGLSSEDVDTVKTFVKDQGDRNNFV